MALRYLQRYFLLALVPFVSYAQHNKDKITIAEGLELIPLTPNMYQHVSQLATTTFGTVACNGLIYINNNEAIICDTPATDTLSSQLLTWLQKNLPHVKIKAVVVNHFHADCLAGLRQFHKAGIKSYAHERTPELLKIHKDSSDRPQVVFSNTLELAIGNKKVVNYYFGEAHTSDNIVTWIPSENTLFGGCMIKSLNAGKGNVADANVKEWPNTVLRVKGKFPQAKIIIPGHGNAGGRELLDYTIKLFN